MIFPRPYLQMVNSTSANLKEQSTQNEFPHTCCVFNLAENVLGFFPISLNFSY